VGALSGDNELWLGLVLIEVPAAPQPSLDLGLTRALTLTLT
jgi:hypothetical protein